MLDFYNDDEQLKELRYVHMLPDVGMHKVCDDGPPPTQSVCNKRPVSVYQQYIEQ